MRYLLLLLMSFPLMGQDGWVPHLVGASRIFQSDLIITNDSQNVGHVFFYSPRSHIIRDVAVRPNARIIVPGYELEQTHVSFQTSSSLTQVAVQYTSQVYRQSLVVPQPAPRAQYFRFDYSFSNQNWLGLAIVNVSNVPIQITAVSIDTAAMPIARQMIASQLAPKDKALTTLEGRFLQDAHGLELVSDGDFVVLPLLGTTREANGQLMNLQPSVQRSRQLVAAVWGGFASDDERVTLTADRLTFQGVSVPYDSSSIFDLWLQSGFMELSLNPSENPCCDMRFYSLELSTGKTANALSYSDVDLQLDAPEAQQSDELMRLLFLEAQRLTGVKSSVSPLDESR